MNEPESVDIGVVGQILMNRAQQPDKRELRIEVESAIHEARVMARDETIKALEEALAAKGKEGPNDTGAGSKTAVANISDASPRRKS